MNFKKEVWALVACVVLIALTTLIFAEDAESLEKWEVMCEHKVTGELTIRHYKCYGYEKELK